MAAHIKFHELKFETLFGFSSVLHDSMFAFFDDTDDVLYMTKRADGVWVYVPANLKAPGPYDWTETDKDIVMEPKHGATIRVKPPKRYAGGGVAEQPESPPGALVPKSRIP